MLHQSARCWHLTGGQHFLILLVCSSLLVLGLLIASVFSLPFSCRVFVHLMLTCVFFLILRQCKSNSVLLFPNVTSCAALHICLALCLFFLCLCHNLFVCFCRVGLLISWRSCVFLYSGNINFNQTFTRN